jgi:hypothetical protein
MTPAMAAGVTDDVWELDELLGRFECPRYTEPSRHAAVLLMPERKPPKTLGELLALRQHLSLMHSTLLLAGSRKNRKCILLGRRLRQVERLIAAHQRISN